MDYGFYLENSNTFANIAVVFEHIETSTKSSGVELTLALLSHAEIA